MLNKRKKGNEFMDKKTGTIIGEGITIENGEIKGTGNVRIDGKFSGNINLEGHIVIGEKGLVKGKISANSGLLAGEFIGELNIKDSVHLASESKVSGLVKSNKVIIDEDAIFNGNCTMLTDEETQNSVLNVLNMSDNTEKEVVETNEEDEEVSSEYYVHDKSQVIG